MADEVDSLVEAVLAADTPARWQETVFSLGPRLMRDPRLDRAVRERIALLRRRERVTDAQTLDRWYGEVRRRIAQQQVMDELLRAGSDAEIDVLLRKNPSVVTADAVRQAIGEVHQIMGRGSPLPPAVAAAAAGPIIAVNLRIAASLGDDSLRAQCLMERAMVAIVTDDHGAALRDFDAATELWRAVGNLRELGRCLSMAGNALLGLDRADEAADRMLEGARFLRDVGDDAMLGPTYEDVAEILTRRGDLDDALTYLELSVHHRVAAGQQQKAARLLPVVVAMRLQRHDMDRALTHAEQLAQLCTDHRELLEPAEVAELVGMIRGAAVAAAVESQGEAEFLRRSGEAGADGVPAYDAYVDPAKLARARRWHTVAERIHRLAPGTAGEAVLAFVDALLSLSAGQLDRAVDQARNALRSFTGEGDHQTIIGLLSLLIQAESTRGNLTAAVTWCDAMLSRLGHDDDDPDRRRSRAMCLISRASCLLGLGRPQPALDDLNQAVRMSRADPDRLARTNEGAAQGGLATVYEFLGDLRAALEANREALRLARLLGHRRGEAAQLVATGVLIGKVATGWWRGDPSPAEVQTLMQVAYQADPSLAGLPPGPGGASAFAIALLERAGRLSEEIHDEVGWTKAMLNLSNLLPETENPRRVAILTDVLRRKEAAGDRLGMAVTLANLGAAYRALDQDGPAAQALTDSLAISRPSGYFESAAQAARDLAGIRQAQGDLRAAEAGFAEAVQMIEAARLQVPLNDRHRVGFIRTRERAYLSLVDLLVDREAFDDAFNLVQRAKSRALLEIVGGTDVQPSVRPVGRVAELLADEADCLSRLRGANRAAGRAEPGDGPPTAPLARLGAIYDELSRFDPEYVSMRRGTPATVAELRGWLIAQQRPVLLVEYFLSGRHLTVFLLRAEWTHVRVHRQPYTMEQMSAGYDDFRRQVVRYRNAAGAGWTELGQALTAPLAPYLRPDDLVYLVPHRLLHGVPIHALPVDSEPLIARHPVAYAPASGLLPLAQNLAKGTGRLDSCVSFGVVFEEEARAVAALFGTEPTGPAGLNAATVQDHCAGQDVCHFSCHGYYNADYPLASGLILQPDGDASTPVDQGRLLTARQVMDMRLRTELICVSACESGSSKVAEGDELLGLIRAFLHAGAPSIVASLWAVDAATTRDLMVAFYRQLRGQYLASRTIDKAGALQQAQLRMMETVGTRSSFYWAPFVLIGDWR